VTDETGTTRPVPDEDAVRRLLADARHTEPMPADVAARMDDVLADLAQSAPVGTDTPDAGPDPAPSSLPIHPVVSSLAAQRRRRAAGMLVAAAAIVVGGVVVAQHLPAPGGSSSASTAGDRAESSGDTAGGTSSSQPVRPEASPGKLAGGRVTVRDGRVVVRPQHFTSDAVAARRLLERTPATAPSYQLLSRSDPACVIPRTHGRRVNATYEHAPAVLVFRPPESSAQVVDLYICGSGRSVRSATLPRP
jgi:hypothetical protein